MLSILEIVITLILSKMFYIQNISTSVNTQYFLKDLYGVSYLLKTLVLFGSPLVILTMKIFVMHFRSYNLSIRQGIKMEAPNTTELNLDALCDLLDDDDEDLAENNAPEDKVQDKKHTADDSKKEQNTTEIPAKQPR